MAIFFFETTTQCTVHLYVLFAEWVCFRSVCRPKLLEVWNRTVFHNVHLHGRRCILSQMQLRTPAGEWNECWQMDQIETLKQHPIWLHGAGNFVRYLSLSVDLIKYYFMFFPNYLTSTTRWGHHKKKFSHKDGFIMFIFLIKTDNPECGILIRGT
jgi:hypothetical protein